MVAPLDWGLGHATRCIPVIRYLAEQGHDVVIAAEGPAAALLQSNFPSLPQVPLPGYRVRYSRKRELFTLKILLQLPGIILAIRRERSWLRKLLKEQHFDLVISDNRYGLYAAAVRSVILTHQLQIMSGMGQKIDGVLRRWHYRLLEKFDECWIVDRQGDDHLAGALSQPSVRPANSRYIGWLSQFGALSGDKAGVGKDLVLILLSGPDPMRGILEKKLLNQLIPMTGYHFVVAAGNAAPSLPLSLPPHIEYNPYLTGDALLEKLREAGLVICRSGYSTLMDLAALGKKALLIPTPGQTEQEYLAGLLHDRSRCLSRSQLSVDLERDIPEALKFPGFEKQADTGFHTELHAGLAETLSLLTT